MARPPTANLIKARNDLLRLQKEYDPDKKGYNVASDQGSTFVASKYTPEQGGYYADGKPKTGVTSANPYYDPNRVSAIKTQKSTLRANKTLPKPKRATRVQASQTSARQSRASANRRRAARGSTILTGSGTEEDERTRKRTLLGS